MSIHPLSSTLGQAHAASRTSSTRMDRDGDFDNSTPAEDAKEAAKGGPSVPGLGQKVNLLA